MRPLLIHAIIAHKKNKQSERVQSTFNIVISASFNDYVEL
jgi:hypothetical protein